MQADIPQIIPDPVPDRVPSQPPQPKHLIELDIEFTPGDRPEVSGGKINAPTLEAAFRMLVDELLAPERPFNGLDFDPLRRDEPGTKTDLTTLFSDHKGNGPIYVVDARCGDKEDPDAISARVEAEVRAIENKLRITSAPRLIIKINGGPSVNPIQALQQLAAEWKTPREKRLAEQRYSKGWRVPFTRPSTWLNPANGVLLTAIAMSIALILQRFALALLTIAAPYLMTIGAVILTLSAVSLLFFAPWEVYKHYKSWKMNAPRGSRPGDYIKDFFGLKAWASQQPVMGYAVIGTVSLGILLSGLLIAAIVGFFLQNSFCLDLLNPVFNAVSPFISSAFDGLNTWFGARLLSSAMITSLSHIVAAVFVSVLPLIAADAIRRLAVTRYDACEASAMNPDQDRATGFDPMLPEKDPGVRACAELKADWNYVLQVFTDLNATTLELDRPHKGNYVGNGAKV